MSGFEPRTYGDRIAAAYDGWPGVPHDADDAVALLAELARGGPVLDVGAGTGRLAVPLAAAGFEVWAVDVSDAMLARLRAKPGGGAVKTVLGDFLSLRCERRFAAIVFAYHTLLYFFARDRQREALLHAARLLAPGGVVVVETYVPDPSRYTGGQRVGANAVGENSLIWFGGLDDPVEQIATAQQLRTTASGTELRPSLTRRIHPAELTLLARAAGLWPRARWSGWRREPVTAGSTTLISVFAAAPTQRSGAAK